MDSWVSVSHEINEHKTHTNNDDYTTFNERLESRILILTGTCQGKCWALYSLLQAPGTCEHITWILLRFVYNADAAPLLYLMLSIISCYERCYQHNAENSSNPPPPHTYIYTQDYQRNFQRWDGLQATS